MEVDVEVSVGDRWDAYFEQSVRDGRYCLLSDANQE